jgi:hypothetical protein
VQLASLLLVPRLQNVGPEYLRRRRAAIARGPLGADRERVATVA